MLQPLQHLATTDKPDFYEETSKLFNRGKRWVYQMLELNDLSEELKTKVSNGEISYRDAIKENKLMTPVKVMTRRLKKNIRQHWGIADTYSHPFYTQLQQWYQQTPELMRLLMATHKFLSDWNELTNVQNEFEKMDVQLGMQLLDQFVEIQQRMNRLVPLLNQAQEENMEHQLQSPPLPPAA